MNLLRKYMRWMTVPVALMVLTMSMPPVLAVAAMIDTQTAVERDAATDARLQLQRLIARDDVRNELLARGIDPVEARARVDSLTDSEARQVARQLDQLPAGGSFIGALVFVAVVMFVVLAITDYTGQTDVFPFIEAH